MRGTSIRHRSDWVAAGVDRGGAACARQLGKLARERRLFAIGGDPLRGVPASGGESHDEQHDLEDAERERAAPAAAICHRVYRRRIEARCTPTAPERSACGRWVDARPRERGGAGCRPRRL